MFRFEDPIYLTLLVLIPILALIRYSLLHIQRKKLRQQVDEELFKQLTPDSSQWRKEVKFWLIESVILLLVIMIARPQLGTKTVTEKRKGIETVIAIDISNSMYAKDGTSYSRIDRTKMLIENLINKFEDDKIGLVVFAGDAFVQLPITSDYVSAKMFLDNIDPSMITTQGTDIARAIELSAECFTEQDKIGRAIILITDGEDHEGNALEAAQKVHEKGMSVFVLGIGDTKGSLIPIPNTEEFMKDNAGEYVMSALNEGMCQEIANAGGGAYAHVVNTARAYEKLEGELNKLATQEITTSVYSKHDEQFQAFCIIILLLLIVDACLLERKNPLFKGVKIFENKNKNKILGGKKGMLLFAIILSCMTMNTFAQDDRTLNREGNRYIRKGNHPKAEQSYIKAREQNPNNAQVEYNLGRSRLALVDESADSIKGVLLDSAANNFINAAKLETNPHRRAMSTHNLGFINHAMASTFRDNNMIPEAIGAYQKAIEYYKESLRDNPNNDATRYNLQQCKRELEKLMKDNPNQSQQQGNNQDKQDQQQQKQQKQKQEQEKQKQEQQQQNKEQKQEKQPKPKQNNMDKETAERLLQSANQQEKATQDRVKKANANTQQRRLQKNW